jgi:cardiolipin synthase
MVLAVTGSTWALLFLLLDIAALLLVLYRKREPATALAWALAILLLPVVGVVLFLMLGLNEIPRRLKRKRRHREGWSGRPGAREGPTTAEMLVTPTPALRVAAALGEPPPTAGNAVDLLPAGREAFDHMFAAIEAARHHVHMEMYIFRHDGLGGRLIDLLAQKAREGVQVRLLLDYMGTWASRALLRRLRDAGGRGAIFLPVWPFGKRFVPNLRNHRKILVCDGEVAFFGGLNVGEEYLGRARSGQEWCDVHLRVRGPAVGDVQAVFCEDWDFCTGERLEGARWYPSPVESGAEVVQILAGGPDREINPIRQSLIYAIGEARERLWIASPYLVPDTTIRDGLRTAALAGVDVTLLSQGLPPDSWLAYYAGAYYYPELLEAGVRIYEYLPGMMHAKMVLVDGLGAAIGTANLDSRSLHLNFELMGVFRSPGVLAAAERRFLAFRERSREITREAFALRGRWRRVAENACRLLAPLI